MATTTDVQPAATALELLQVDPARLGIRDQAREDATPDEQLIDSVRAHGLIQPPVVEFDESAGEYKIVTGHRRVGAAIAAGMDLITVIVRPQSDAPVTLEQQIVENERRRQLTAKDLAKGYERLTLFGLTPQDIAAQLGERPERVRAGLKINTSTAAAALIEEAPDIDFGQAATIAEFDDHPKLQKKLIETATTRPENFDRDVEAARQDAQVADRVAELTAELERDGIPVVDVQYWEGSWWTAKGGSMGGPGRTLQRLEIDTADHIHCPGHAAIIHRASAHYLDKDPGIDVLYVCTDWKANGHDTAPAAREKTPEEVEREEAFRRQAEERAQREAVIAANTRARRAWLRGHLTTGRLRPTASHFDLLAAAAFAETGYQEAIPFHVVLQLLDGKERERDGWNTTTSEDELLDLIDARQTPALRIAIAVALARFEVNLDAFASAGYWPALTGLGYTLTDTDKEHQASTVEALAEWRAERAGEATGGPEGDEDVEGGEDE